MKKQLVIVNTQLENYNIVSGESIEEKMRRVTETNEAIKDDGAPLIYTDRKDGVMPEYDIRTDRFDIAQEAMDKVQKSVIAKRQQRIKTQEKPQEEIITQPTQTTE